MNKRICTPHEVKKYSPADEAYSTADVCPNISRVERVAFSKCWLGLDKYDEIVADLNETDLPIYEVKAYSKGDGVTYNGVQYTSDVDINTKTPDDGDWTITRKFKSDEIQALWDEGGLKEWLAFLIFHSSVKFSHFKSSANGTTKAGDTDGRSKITHEEFVEYKRGIKFAANDSLELLYEYMKRAGILPSSSSSDCGCGEHST